MRKSSRGVTPKTWDAIQLAADEYRLQGRDPNAAEIARRLSHLADLPTERSIRDIVKLPAGTRPDDPWRLATSAVDPATVLPTLMAVVESTEGRRTQLKVKEADLIARIRSSTPALSALGAWVIARAYLNAMDQEDVTALRAIESYLAFGAPQPNGGEPWDRYVKAVDAGWIPMTPTITRVVPGTRALKIPPEGLERIRARAGARKAPK